MTAFPDQPSIPARPAAYIREPCASETDDVDMTGHRNVVSSAVQKDWAGQRPYGNSNVYGDIAEILDVPETEWADEDLNPSLDAEWRFLRLHVETASALQIALATGEFRAGRYVRDDEWDRQHWRRAEA
jgi:hypothetical protein